MGATVLAILIAAGLGLLAGGYYAVMGWIIVGNLLLLTTATAAVAANAHFLVALGWVGVTIVAFNIGLILSLMIRNTAVLRDA